MSDLRDFFGNYYINCVYLQYHNSEDAKKALEQMNGFELAGRPMKVNNVTDRHEFVQTGPGIDETDERAGIDLGATGRLQLMYKLAEGNFLLAKSY